MPRYVIDEAVLTKNLQLLRQVAERSGARILLAQKAFSCTATYPLCSRYLAGTTASSLFEARHAKMHFPGEVHIFNPAFAPGEIDEVLSLVDYVVFNSPRQVRLYGEKARRGGVSVGLRVNPEVSVASVAKYDACRAGSRFGVTRAQLTAACGAAGFQALGLDGLHFHALCEQGLAPFRQVLAGFEEHFGDLIPLLSWVNFGGGHHITRVGYEVEGLIETIKAFRARYPQVQVYLEPGEAVALNAGTLEATVLEVQPQDAAGISNVILDVSAACHMPDVLEMPYQPPLVGARLDAQGPYVYRLGGPTCLAGDEIGTYSMDTPLNAGDAVVFGDMAIYTMVKNNMFNGINLPEIVIRHVNGQEEVVRRFGYEDFACRL